MIAFANTDVQPTSTAASQKRGWLPLLTILFLISYGIMTMLIVEQGTTIEIQRALIHDLFHDSAELSALKAKAVRERNALRNGQTNSPKVDPSVQPPSSQAPSSQAVPQHGAKNQGKTHVQVPSRPASDLNDDRRMLRTI